MNVLVVGDVHGCYHTFEKLVRKHWRPESDYLVQVGDLINKGQHSAACVQYARELEEDYPYQVFFLKGNHEERYLKYVDLPGKSRSVDRTRKNFDSRGWNRKKLHNWLDKRPLKWETPHMLVTHAGISKRVKKPYVATNPLGVVHNRSPIKNIGKLQVFGHIIQLDGLVRYHEKANAWCIDTGAWAGNGLSAIRFSYTGDVLDHIFVRTKKQDLNKRQLKIRSMLS